MSPFGPVAPTNPRGPIGPIGPWSPFGPAGPIKASAGRSVASGELEPKGLSGELKGDEFVPVELETDGTGAGAAVLTITTVVTPAAATTEPPISNQVASGFTFAPENFGRAVEALA